MNNPSSYTVSDPLLNIDYFFLLLFFTYNKINLFPIEKNDFQKAETPEQTKALSGRPSALT